MYRRTEKTNVQRERGEKNEGVRAERQKLVGYT